MIQLDLREQTQVMTTSVKPSPETSTLAKVESVKSGVRRWLTPILYPLGRRVIMPFYFRQLMVTGQENIPKTGPVILAPTHRSRWDGLMIPYVAGKPVTGRDLRYMVSADEMKGIQGWFIRQMGGFPVNTKHPGIGSLRHGVELLRNGEALVIFPEGNIFQDGQLHPLKPGLARIALQVESSKPGSGLKIVPISIRYSQPVPHWRCDATVRIGVPLNVADYHTGSTKKSAQRLTSDLERSMSLLELGEEKTVPDFLSVPMP